MNSNCVAACASNNHCADDERCDMDGALGMCVPLPEGSGGDEEDAH